MSADKTVLRPNGKPYRRRTPPTALCIDWGPDYEAEAVVIVERTHDVAEALPLARAEWRRNGNPADEFVEEPEAIWLRLVPWDAIGSGADSTYLSCHGTEPGSYPALRFGGSS